MAPLGQLASNYSTTQYLGCLEGYENGLVSWLENAPAEEVKAAHYGTNSLHRNETARHESNIRLGIVDAAPADQVDIHCKHCGATSRTRLTYNGQPVTETCTRVVNKLTKKRCMHQMVCVDPAEQSRTVSRSALRQRLTYQKKV